MTAPKGVVVTGGTGALGRAVVGALLERGARVAVPYNTAPRWHALQEAFGGTTALRGWPVDLSDAQATNAFVDEAVAWLPRLDGVAALAGAYAGGATLEAAPAGDWDRMRRQNLDTAWTVCRAALPHLLKQGGSVVTVGSRVTEADGVGAAAYTVSKAAVQALTRVLALENRARGVRFNCVTPGIIDTADNRQAMPKADRSQWTSPEAIARVVAFLLSADSAPVTGAMVPVDAA